MENWSAEEYGQALRQKARVAMPPSSLRHWFPPDDRDVCPPCGETAVVTTDEARSSVASRPISCEDADGAFTLAVSSLGGLAPVLGADAPPPPDPDGSPICGLLGGGVTHREGWLEERSPARCC
jgi:hypothetical protein